jgi:hypothetical protein
MRKSKLNSEKKENEILRLSRLSPEERLQAQVKLNGRVKKLFYAGLQSQGFPQKEIIRLWRQR